MMYLGKAITLESLGEGMVEMALNLQDESVNKLNNLVLDELHDVVAILEENSAVKGLLISSEKDDFVVGADVTEFSRSFAVPAMELKNWLNKTLNLLARLENLPFPTVSAINGVALGGGLELALSTDFRVLETSAKIGLPEVQLGLCPGWGGTVRLSRLIGPEVALEWLLTGKVYQAARALELRAVDALADAGAGRTTARALLAQAMSGEISYLDNRKRKMQPLLDSVAVEKELDGLRQRFSAGLDPNYPAAGIILDTVLQHSRLGFTDALKVETEAFIYLAKSDCAKSLIGLFLNDQFLKKKSREWSRKTEPVQQAAVLGAGIMGGGVAYQSAVTGTPIIMKDIQQGALELGAATAAKLLDRQIAKGRLDAAGKQLVMSRIDTTLDYQGFDRVDLVVEAVVENPAVKVAVLSELEQRVGENTVLTSNTSTISIDLLADKLKRPEQFCGMHFFNPVHLMPLVEVIRGSKSSDAAVARTVAYARSMGKTPIVVNDCPGFLVNRILFPYFNGFNRLLMDGVDFERIDRVMEAFGWPMGPAYLADVVGIDTMVHADQVMQQGFPERMAHDHEVVTEILMAADQLGQKNGKGFYLYTTDTQGNRIRVASDFAKQQISSRVQSPVNISDEAIIDRMMIPMCLEAVRCLEDGIADTPAEVDMGLILGLGFPRFRGGALRYIDTLGLPAFASRLENCADLGSLYAVTDELQQRIQQNRPFYG